MAVLRDNDTVLLAETTFAYNVVFFSDLGFIFS